MGQDHAASVYPYHIEDAGIALTVSDYVRLAAAGIKIEYSEIRRNIMPDIPGPPVIAAPPPLAELIWERWRRRANVLHRSMRMEDQFFPPPFQLFATECGDKIYVCVATAKTPPVIIEDSTDLFPSDALMASLILLLETRK